MEVTPAEAQLIFALREIDRRNPAGIDGFSEQKYLGFFQGIADGAAAEGERRYQLFIKQTQGGVLVDLREAQRTKGLHEDPRAPASDSDRGSPVSLRVITSESEQEKTWPEMTEDEQAAYTAQIWRDAEPGTVEHAAKTIEAPAAAMATALEVVEAIRKACETVATAEGLRNEFDPAPAADLLSALRLRVKADREARSATG